MQPVIDFIAFAARWLVCLLMLLIAFHGTEVMDLIAKWYFGRYTPQERVELERQGKLRPIPTTVCGRLGGHVFEVDLNYMQSWVEYEGKRAWEKDFGDNKTGCDANVVSLPLVMSWPGLQPEGEGAYLSHVTDDRLSVVLEPYYKAGQDLSYLRDLYQGPKASHVRGKVAFDSTLGLHTVAIANLLFKKETDALYWSEDQGQVNFVMRCLGSTWEGPYFLCEAFYVIEHLETFVRLKFLPSNVSAWQAIKRQSEAFVYANLKKIPARFDTDPPLTSLPGG
ncbi:MAG: hypothetical protein PW845_01795 [Pseudomonas sp.]|nr:hypothetical protein [Pseudomonas sp.]